MELSPIISEEARLFSIVSNTIQFKERATLILERTQTQRGILRIGNLYYFLTPSTILWFDRQQDQSQNVFTYYFNYKQNEDVMIKVHNNVLELHQKIIATRCQLRERKQYFKLYQQKALNISVKYPHIETISGAINTGGALVGSGISKGAEYCAGGIQKLGGYIAGNVNDSDANYINLPTLKNISQKVKTLSQNAMDLASGLIGRFFSNPTVNNHIIPQQHNHPLVKAGKKVLGGAINVYTGVSDGINYLEVGIAAGAGQVIEKKYGEDLKQILKNAVQIGNNCQGIIKQPLREVGKKLTIDNPQTETDSKK